GVTIYAAVFVATLFWALWEVGLHGWALVPRVVGPLVLFFVVLALVPAISASRTARQLALGGLVGALALVIAGGIGVVMSARAPEPRPLPPAQLAMTEPSLWPVGADWPAYGGTYSARRYSPLSEITPDNVRRLERAWVAHTRDLPSERAKNKYGAETTPLKVGDSLYLC